MTEKDIIDVLNLTGTIAFAISGAVVAGQRNMDLFGALVLAFVTAVAGGIVRDMMIGAVPPDSIADWRPAALAALAGLVAFFFPAIIARLRFPVLLFDAAGLGIFAVTGTQKALEFGIPPAMAVVLGTVTGVGGGMVRDVLTAQVPVVLRTDIYAVAALAGGALVAVGHAMGMPAVLTLLPGAALCFFLRLMAIYCGWHLPRARPAPAPPEG
ncbi:trimeric intracellular cation channel family protein [Aquabacter sp. L1I39]|uniref:trimeric intracellular cation channel family protein n=1 Tax=Aquabacter sp. L1I39 TaxID=2820278 RepID=UPI001FFCB5B4|nr:TRIC cation channel family protein [Aquabacter sp. L1I39]